MDKTPSELKGWEDIEKQIAATNDSIRAIGLTSAAQKAVLSVVNLSENVFNAQKHISQRLNTLNEQIEASGKSAEKLARSANWLSLVIALATIAGVIIAAIKK